MAKRCIGLEGVVNGTSYSHDTDPKVVEVLERIRGNREERVCITYGDPKTGTPWDDRPECGSIGRSTGRVKIPLLISRRTSTGGGAVMDSKVLLITSSRGRNKTVFYRHPKFKKR